MFGTKKIIVKRDSICMADDCTAPNACEFAYSSEETLKDLVIKISRYLPELKAVVWSINNKGNPIGYINFCSEDKKFELIIENIRLADLDNHNFYCKFYDSNKLMDFSITPPELLYPECETLLQKVKKYEKTRKDLY